MKIKLESVSIKVEKGEYIRDVVNALVKTDGDGRTVMDASWRETDKTYVTMMNLMISFLHPE